MNNNLKQLLDTDIAFSKMSQEKGMARAFTYYLTHNAIMLPQNQNPIVGIREISQSLTGQKEILTWEPKGEKIS